jgi:signal transduction histidine kinase
MKNYRNIFLIIIVCLLYSLSAKLGLKYAVIGQTVTFLWPPSGIALASILLSKNYQVAFGIALGAAIANSGSGLPLVTLTVITMGNTIEPILGAFWLRRRKCFSNSFEKLPDVLDFVSKAGIISTMVGASFGTLGLYLGNAIQISDVGYTWVAWWLGDGMGVIVIAPLFLIACNSLGASFKSFSVSNLVEAFILLCLLIAVGESIFEDSSLAGLGNFQISLCLFPFTIWSALRFGLLGASSVSLIISVLTIHGTSEGTGPFAVGTPMNSLILWCLFTDLIAISGLILATIDSERKNVLIALRESNTNLDNQIQKKTQDLIQANIDLHAVLAERWRLQSEMNHISEESKKLIGQELHDGLGQHIIGIAFLVSSLEHLLSSKLLTSELETLHNIQKLLDESLSMIRMLSRGLYPTALETGGFISALRQLTDFTQSSSEVKCIFQMTARLHIRDKAIILHLYRIAQEAISNALKHSNAKNIVVKLAGSNDNYTFSIEDDGIGFSLKGMNINRTFGLRSMQCRADLIKAQIELIKNQDGGTSVVITGPMNPKEQLLELM